MFFLIIRENEHPADLPYFKEGPLCCRFLFRCATQRLVSGCTNIKEASVFGGKYTPS